MALPSRPTPSPTEPSPARQGLPCLGVNTLIGLGTFAVLAAVGIGWLGRRGRHDVVTALALVMMLALGAAFLSRTTEYSPEIFALLFGELLGVSSMEILPVAALGIVCLAGVAVLYRPLLLSSIIPESPRRKASGATGWRWPSSSSWRWPRP